MKKIVIVLIIVGLISVSGGLIYHFSNEDKNTDVNLENEKDKEEILHDQYKKQALSVIESLYKDDNIYFEVDDKIKDDLVMVYSIDITSNKHTAIYYFNIKTEEIKVVTNFYNIILGSYNKE